MSKPTKHVRFPVALTGAALCGVLLTGCGVVSDAADQGRQALDSATQAVDTVEGIIGAGAQLAAACAAAQVAWLPGTSSADAYAAIDEAAGMVDGLIAENPSLPGATEIDAALDSARAAVGADETSFGVARQTLQTACALVSLGG
jgi:hypothetical protein